MSTEQNKIYIKKLISLASIASASVFLSLPALAETPNSCGSYRGNATTGGGWPCAMDRVNGIYPNGEASTMERQSTTGASSSGNGVTSNSRTNTMESSSMDNGSRTMDQQSTTSQSTTIERRSTTTTYPANRVTPNPNRAATMEQPQEPTVTNTTTVNQSTDQGVRALW